jgi:8-oxo-dGTP diphosphatase
MNLQVGVKILLQNQEGKYLLLQRNAEKYPETGPKWDLPGGRIDTGMSLFENLKRELEEETKMQIIGEPKLFMAQDILKSDKHVVRLTYIGEGTREVVLSDEHLNFGWFSVDEILILDPLDRYTKEVIEKIKTHGPHS